LLAICQNIFPLLKTSLPQFILTWPPPSSNYSWILMFQMFFTSLLLPTGENSAFKGLLWLD
jgi:hypothetical protein